MAFIDENISHLSQTGRYAGANSTKLFLTEQTPPQAKPVHKCKSEHVFFSHIAAGFINFAQQIFKIPNKNVFRNAPVAGLSNKAQNTAQGTKDILQAGGRVHLCRCCTSYQLKHATSPAVTRTFSSRTTVAQSAPV